MDDLIQLLHEGKHSLVVANGEVCTFNGRGVIDLYHLLQDDPGFLYEASIADKVVGKAAAALLALANVKEVYADVIRYKDKLWSCSPAYYQSDCYRMVSVGNPLL